MLEPATRSKTSPSFNEVQALAEAVLEAAGVAGLGVTVSFGEGIALRHIYVNEPAAKILGYTTDELLGGVTAVTFAPEERERMVNVAAGWRKGEIAPRLVETAIVRKDGERVPVEIAMSIVQLAGAPAVVTLIRDIAERKAAEDARKILQSQLALSDRMATLGMLAAGVAHEINNPLAYATLNVEKLVRHLPRSAAEDPTDSVGPAITAARDGLARVATIVRDLQSLSMPTSADRWPVDVREVIDSALNVAMHAIRGRARIVRDYRDVAPLKTDPTRLGQIVLNLVFNAAQSFESLDEARNLLSVGVSGSGEEVIVTVADNGSGIPAENLRRIFEPFYTTKARGMGLGLAICQTLATSLGGTLEVESEVGRGTRFTLRLAGPGQAK
jgi:two-component system, NtrC family, sensor kinase